MKKSIIGCFKNENQIKEIIEQISTQNYSMNDISMICPNKGKSSSVTKASWTKEGHVQEEATQSPASQKNYYSMLSQCVTINVPGLGSFKVAGPVKTYLSSSSHHEILKGGFFSTFFNNCGMSESEARKYEDNLKKGCFILMYQHDDMSQMNQFRDLCTKAGAQDLSMSAGAPKSKKANV